MLRFEDLRVRDQQTLDRDFFNRRFRLIAETITKLGTGLDSVNDATDNLVALGLVRVNEVLGPLLAKVQAASENGFLVARSSTPLTLAVGLETTLAIADTAERDLFTPTPYVLISRDADEAANDWAILRVQGYNRENGGLAFEVVALNGDIGATAHDDWVVSATTGVAPAIMEAAAQVTQLVETAESASTLAQQAAASPVYSELKNLCVWAKTNGGMGSLYRSQHEIVFVYKAGTAPHINNVELGKHGRYRTNVWSYAGANTFSKTRDDDLAMHPTVKPVALVADAILDCSKRNGIVLDAFGGSGTTLVAAERTGRRGYAIELDPHYCDVIVRRVAKIADVAIVHAKTGKTFSEIAAERAETIETEAV